MERRKEEKGWREKRRRVGGGGRKRRRVGGGGRRGGRDWCWMLRTQSSVHVSRLS